MTEDTDPFFGFLVGLYATALVAPAVTVGLVTGGTTDPTVLFFALLGTVVVVTAGVGWAARSKSVAVALGRTRWVWLTPVVGFGFGAVLLLGALETEFASGAVVGVSMLGMFAGAFVGMGFAVAAQNRHTKAVLADAEEYARFSARAPEQDRRVTKQVAITLGVVGLVGMAVSLFPGYESGLWAFQLLIPVAAGLVGATTDRTFAITDAGLLVGKPMHKRIRPWSAFESYSLTDDALVLHRTGWSPWGLRDVRRDPEEVEDAAAVERALAEFLPRR